MKQNYCTPKSEKNQINRKHFNHLSMADRINIERLLNLKNDKDYKGPKITISYIASYLGVNKSTVSREIKRGTYRGLDGKTGAHTSKYLASFGKGVHDKNAERSHYKRKLTKDSEELKELTKLLNSGADPLTALCLYEEKHKKPFPLCEKSIYNYFHRKDLVLKRGSINPRKHRKFVKKEQKMTQKGTSIEERSEEINNRTELGHWEGDLIVGPRGSSSECLLTILERKSRIFLAFKIKSKEMKSVVEGLDKLESKLTPEQFKMIFKSITFDNGVEFRDVKGITTLSDGSGERTKAFYAHPYCSFERGSNENANRMMRKYFPKGTKFEDVTDISILRATNQINFNHRKLFDNKTAAETLKNLNETFYNAIEILGLKNPYSKYLCN